MEYIIFYCDFPCEFSFFSGFCNNTNSAVYVYIYSKLRFVSKIITEMFLKIKTSAELQNRTRYLYMRSADKTGNICKIDNQTYNCLQQINCTRTIKKPMEAFED